MVVVIVMSLLGAAPVNAGIQLHAAYRGGNAAATLELCGALLKKVDRGEIEDGLRRAKLPPLGKIILDSRLAVARQGLTSQTRRPDARELDILLPHFLQHINRELLLVTKNKLLQQHPAPRTLEGFVDLMWQHYSFQNRLNQAVAETKYFVDIIKKFPRGQIRRLGRESARILNPDVAREFSDVAERLIHKRLEREMELRLARLNLAVATLQRERLDVERIYAAGTWRTDATILSTFLRKSKPELSALRRDGLIKHVARQTTEAKRLAGSLTQRAEALFQMLFWWTRGRYGIGTHDLGLTKHPLAYRMSALQMQLIMPEKRPLPTVLQKQASKSNSTGKKKKPTKEEPPLPRFDRRHHYWWSLGEREVSESSTQFGRPREAMVRQVKTGFM